MSTDDGGLRFGSHRSRSEAVDRLHAAWRDAGDTSSLAAQLKELLVPVDGDDAGLVALEFAAREGSFDVTDELLALWDSWESLDLVWRQAVVSALARRVGRHPRALHALQSHVLDRPEVGEALVPLFLSSPHWFTEHGTRLLALYPHARAAILAAGQLILDAVEKPAPARASDEARRMIGSLLDYDAAEVFEKLDVMLDAAPELGEPLIGEMAARGMDLRGVAVALRDRVPREVLKRWLQDAIPDELELLVYLALL